MALDNEDRNYIAEQISGLRIELKTEIAANQNQLVAVLTDIKESLERQYEQLSVRAQDQPIRLERHAGLLQTGSRWTVRTQRWQERVDGALEVKDRQIADLNRRIEELEKRQRAS